MTKISCALENSAFDRNPILLESERTYMFFPGHGFYIFTKRNKIRDNLSIMGKNMLPYPITTGERNRYFSNHFKTIKNGNIGEDTLLIYYIGDLPLTRLTAPK